jgi:hypothetical protein
LRMVERVPRACLGAAADSHRGHELDRERLTGSKDSPLAWLVALGIRLTTRKIRPTSTN